jgi:hypothetical protein
VDVAVDQDQSEKRNHAQFEAFLEGYFDMTIVKPWRDSPLPYDDFRDQIKDVLNTLGMSDVLGLEALLLGTCALNPILASGIAKSAAARPVASFKWRRLPTMTSGKVS